MAKKSITLPFVGFIFRGIVTCKGWMGGEGQIEMDKFQMIGYGQTIPKKSIIAPLINDAGFGCQRMIRADVDVYRLYKGDLFGGVEEFEKTIKFNEKDLTCSKRGI